LPKPRKDIVVTRHRRLWLFVLTALLAAGGSSCPRLRPPHEPAPIIFRTPPTLSQIIHYVNSATARVQQLETTGASLSAQGMLSLRANIALERPRRFRLQAGLTGPEIDLGSNDEVFWFWAKRSQPAAVYFCRHDQFPYAAAREILPVQPDWIAEALGLVYFDPALSHQGPFPRGPDQLEIRSIVPSPDGNLTKVTVIDALHAWVLQQQIYDPRGQLLASAIASRHRYDPIAGISLPRQVDIQLPPAQLSFTIQVADYLVNKLSGNPQQLWSMPHLDGYPLVDLCRPSRPQPIVSPHSFSPGYDAPYPLRSVRLPPPYTGSSAPPYGDYPRRP
jgi:hypothetical protein